MSEHWPDKNVEYNYPTDRDENRKRWQRAINDSLKEKRLQLRPEGRSMYELVGACPRCDHQTSQDIEFGPYNPLDNEGLFNIICDCREAHENRDADHNGCGWAGSLTVSLKEPRELARGVRGGQRAFRALFRRGGDR